jgi:undecaprenyl diphosphate synthase
LKEGTPITSRIQSDSVPRHVAIIMDGNGRWATKQGLPRIMGHHAGANNCRLVVQVMKDCGVHYLTIYAFSTENWKRPTLEVKGLFRIMAQFIVDATPTLHAENIKVRHIGSMENLPKVLQNRFRYAVELTRDNTGMNFTIALNYGGRADILNAVRILLQDNIKPEEITEELFSRYLYTADIPDPDLIIRTGAEMRTSNFLLWQGAYSEYYFTPTLWPAFNEAEIEKVFEIYGQRNRRFGGL